MTVTNLKFVRRVGLSHVLDHKLGATYHIPHGITSCLTLGPVITLKASIAPLEDKEALARVLEYLRIASSNNVQDDVRTLGTEIVKLVDDLGLKTSLSAYNVPREDLPKIAARALDLPESENGKLVSQVIELLEGIYD